MRRGRAPSSFQIWNKREEKRKRRKTGMSPADSMENIYFREANMFGQR